jgi:hypothetical protein
VRGARPRSSALAFAALALAALALSGCETTAEKSAKLEKAALARQRASGGVPGSAGKGLTITTPSKAIRVVAASALRDSEGAAAVVTLRNDSAAAVRDVPIEVTVRDAHGATVYSNATAGLSPTLTTVAYVPAHGQLDWVDDQVQASSPPAAALARVGEGSPAPGGAPALAISGTRLFEDPTNGLGAEGTIANRSTVTQRELVIYVVGRRGASVVAAGRAVLPQLAAGASTRFQVFFIGSPQGARLQVYAPPSTLR